MDRSEILIQHKGGPAIEVRRKNGELMTILRPGSDTMTLYMEDAASLQQFASPELLPQPKPDIAAKSAQLAAGAMAAVNSDAELPPPGLPGADTHAPLTTTASMGDTLEAPANPAG